MSQITDTDTLPAAPVETEATANPVSGIDQAAGNFSYQCRLRLRRRHRPVREDDPLHQLGQKGSDRGFSISASTR